MNVLRKLTKKPSSTARTSIKDQVASSRGDVNVPSRTMPTRRPQEVPSSNMSAGEPPPAYTPQADGNTQAVQPASIAPATPVVPAVQASVVPAVMPQEAQAGQDSPYSFLKQFDTIFLIDDSGSMAGRSWKETSQALGVITPICTSHDADGIDIYFLNHRQRTNSGLGGYTNITSTAAVNEIFTAVRPSGGTPTGTRLSQILKPYLHELETDLEKQKRGQNPSIKPLNIIVITDGVPSDDVETIIVKAAEKLDKLEAEPWQVGIQFFQVGQEPEAAEELRVLDDVLAKEFGIRDMVDTVPWSGEEGHQLSAAFVLKVVMGSINRRLDRKKA